jgi:monothiol glutaredoxin
VVLFMKGTRAFPQCGFSAHVVDVLEEHGADYEDIDVLEDPELRLALKEYSDWPTFPQLYVDRQLVGGCDIVSELADLGEIEGLLAGEAQAIVPA